VGQLDNALAEVGVDDLDAGALQLRVEVALLGEHRLALHQTRDPSVPEEPEDDGIVLCRVGRPVHPGPQGQRLALELLEVLGEPGESVELDSRGRVSERLPVGHGAGGAVALAAHLPDRGVVPVKAGVVPDQPLCCAGVGIHTGCRTFIRAPPGCNGERNERGSG
jgi:hypothetical protein